MAQILPHHDTLERKALLHLPKETAIPWGRCHTELLSLAAKQGLFFQGKRLVPDFFGRATLAYEVNAQDTSHTIRVLITAGSTSFYLDQCSWVCPGPPLLFIHGIALKVAQHYIPTEWLWKLSKAPLLLDSAHFYRFSKECLDPDDPDLPSLIGERIESKTETPLPLLRLRDRVGATAQLLMIVNGKRHSITHSTPKSIIKEAQHWEKDLLETDFVRQQSASGSFYCPIDRVAKSLCFLIECGWKVEDYLGREVVIGTPTAITATQTADTVILKGGVRFDDFESDTSSLVGAFNRRESFIQLSTHQVGLLPDNSAVAPLVEAAAEGEICSEGIRLPLNRLGVMGKQLEEIEGIEDFCSRLSSAAHNFTGLEPAPPASTFQGALRSYQQTGVNWLSFLDHSAFGGILADDMGLGKTVQILAYLSRVKKGTSLIIVPRSLLFNWKHEIKQFLPSAHIYIHHGSDRIQDSALFSDYTIVLTSYGILRRDLPLLQKISWRSVVLDEAQAIKNPDSKSAQAAYALQADLRVALSGTPIENHLMELWSLFRFALPSLLDQREAFAREMTAAESDPRYLKRLQRKVRPFILRRTKAIAAPDLPEKIEQTIWVELSSPQRARYEAFLSGARSGLLKKVTTEGAKKHRMEILETLLRLRQICCHPQLVDSEENTTIESAKLDALLLDLENVHAEGHKALVYSQFTSMLTLIKQALEERGLRYSYLDGSTRDREGAVARFQEDPDIPFFLISLKAGSTGLNLTQADYVFLFDPWWNRAAENQAIDRAHRIGRKDRVIARRYVAANTIEEKILRLAERKSALSDALIGEEKLGEALSSEDLALLLE